MMTLEKPGIHRAQLGVSLSLEAQPGLPEPIASFLRRHPRPALRQKLPGHPPVRSQGCHKTTC